MAVVSLDLSEESLSAATTLGAYRAWARTQEAELQAGLASVGFFDRPADLETSLAYVGRHRSKIKSFIDHSRWRARMQEGVEAALLLFRPPHPAVRLYALVGCGRSDSSAGSSLYSAGSRS
jgi:hypothetical protein